MADFCKQCSERIFGEVYREFAADKTEIEAIIARGEDPKTHGSWQLCEGCGHRWVNVYGECSDDECKEHYISEEEMKNHEANVAATKQSTIDEDIEL